MVDSYAAVMGCSYKQTDYEFLAGWLVGKLVDLHVLCCMWSYDRGEPAVGYNSTG